VVPASVPGESSVVEDIEAGIRAAMDRVIAALTEPLSPEEKSPRPRETEKLSRIIFKGHIEEVNRFFYKRGWTDGLPVIPPTEEAVAAMLQGTDLPPDYLVAELGPRCGKATVEKIAINAVMAGALPTYMPVLIAGIQSLISFPEYGFLRLSVSTGSWAPFWIINGPVRNDLFINCRSGALSPGDIANAAIGRAFGLIIKNIGGIRKGIEDMGVLGNPGKYSLVIGENEEDSPWEPMHVEHGFKREDSTITVSFPNTYIQMWPYGSDDEGIMRALIYNLMPGRGGGFCLLLTPPHARTLANHGWTKKSIKTFISEYARAPAYRMPSYWGVSPAVPGVTAGLQGSRVPMREMDEVPIIKNPESIAIIVAGGPGAFIGQLAGGTGVVGGTVNSWEKAIATIKLPANWDSLVAQYKNVVPTYLRY
jgi:hypothetical protein